MLDKAADSCCKDMRLAELAEVAVRTGYKQEGLQASLTGHHNLLVAVGIDY